MLNIHLRSTGERYRVPKFDFNSKIRDLKTVLEIICGVPAHLQILSYLDEGDLQDSHKLKHYDPVIGCTFIMDVWFIYEPIVQAVVANKESKLFELGVLPDIPFSSAVADRLSPEQKKEYIRERASVALFTASHRERLSIVRRLCENDVGVNYQTAAGRTPLMVATARGSLSVMELLLEHGARLDIRDAFGQTAESFSVIFNQKQSRRTIIQFKWKKRNEASIKEEREIRSAKSRAKSEIEQEIDLLNLKKQERLERMAEQRKKREEYLAIQQVRIPKSKTISSQSKPMKRHHSLVRTHGERDKETEIMTKNFEGLPINGEVQSISGATTTATAAITTPKSNEKLFAHQFSNVYEGMTYEEWTKVRDSFLSYFFPE